MTPLQNLWHGNIRSNEDKVITDEEKKLVELIARHHETLSSSLKNDEKYLKEALEDEFKFRQEIVAGRIDIEGEAIERSGEGQAGESSTSATSSNGSRTELDRPDPISSTNERNADNIDRELKSSGTEGRSAEISGELQEGLSGYEGRSNGKVYISKNRGIL